MNCPPLLNFHCKCAELYSYKFWRILTIDIVLRFLHALSAFALASHIPPSLSPPFVQAAIEPFVPNFRATALQQAGAPSLTVATAISEKPGAPRTSTVTSISSSNPPSVPAAIPASTHAQTALARRNRRHQPTLAATAVATVSPRSQHQENANSTSGRSSAAVAATVGPSAEVMLILHSVQAGLGRDTVLERIKTIVPARTVVRVRPATSLEAAAAGVGQTGGPLVVEFTNELNARSAFYRG